MPFVTKTFELTAPQKSFLFVMQALQCNQKEAQKHLDKHRLRQNNIPISKSQTIEGKVELTFFEAQKMNLKPIFLTPFFAIYDKPPKMLVHPKGYFEHLSLTDAIKSQFGKEANLVHRIDYETSGLVMASIDKKHESSLKALFAKKQVIKRYIAIVKGNIPTPLTLDFPICVPNISDKHKDLGILCKIDPNGKKAITKISPLDYDKAKDTTLLEVMPITGRTHQIRVHLAHISHPIVGEELYGVDKMSARKYLEEKSNSRLLLHAQSLEFSYKGIHYYIKSDLEAKNFQMLQNLSVL